MKLQDYIDHLKAMGATFVNMEADVVATLSDIQLMITACQLDANDKVVYDYDYGAIVGTDTTPTVFIVDICQDGVWLADEFTQTKVCELEQ